ncbi:MAG: class I adenylate cyclase [Gammaproteobacteria bacterium]
MVNQNQRQLLRSDFPAVSKIADIEIDALELRYAHERFKALNVLRLQRVRDSVNQRQLIFLDLLPLLFHVNHPMLPGYHSGEVPCGISHYSPDTQVLERARSLARTFRPDHQREIDAGIHAIYLMGSTGTIAWSRHSDFDVWICHEPGIEQAQYDLLQNKAHAIESWAESLGLEVHFFVLDDASFREQSHSELSEHSSGDAQHHLLLDEFYRTSVLIAGRYPVWWLIPPQHEGNYQAYKNRLLQNRFINHDEFVDFGGLESLPVDEFYGAALWQLNKAIDSPYKSMLKLLLLESYVDSYPDSVLLASRFKEKIYQQDGCLEDLDPYSMILQAIEDHLFSRRESKRIDMLRRCFYIKVDLPLTKPSHKDGWRKQQLQAIVDSWGWGQDKLQHLDARKQWKTPIVAREFDELLEELQFSYLRLKAFARMYASRDVAGNRDLAILGRKLSLTFDPQEGRILLFNPGISHDIAEPELTLWYQEASDEWFLLAGKCVALPEKAEMLTVASSLLEVLAWGHFNRVLSAQQTRIHLQPQGGVFLTHWELQSLILSLQDFFSSSHKVDIANLETAAYLSKSCVFINCGLDSSQGKSESFSYGQQQQNLVVSCEQVSLSSWQEIVTGHFSGGYALADSISDYLAWFPIDGLKPAIPTCFCFSSTMGNALARRVEQIYADMIACFYEQNAAESARYILQANDEFMLFETENSVPRYRCLATLTELYSELANVERQFTRTYIDKLSLQALPLALLYAENKENTVQLFYETEGMQADIYIVDEWGALFRQHVPFRDQSTLLNPWLIFLGRVAANNSKITYPLEVFQITRNRNHVRELRQVHVEVNSRVSHPLSVSLSHMDNALSVQEITIRYANKQFSSMDGDLIQQAAEAVMASRSSGEQYPLYLTDIEMTEGKFSQATTVQLLQMKRNLESRLNAAISRLEAIN